MVDPAAELQRQLQLLADQFTARLQRELPELISLAEALPATADEALRLPVLENLRQQLHKLAGSAGTFGFAELGQEARRLEQQSASWLAHGHCPGAELTPYLQAIQQLPQLAGQEPGKAATEEPLQLSGEVRVAASGYRIAILEDDTDVGRSMELTLQNFGYQAHWYSTTQALDERLQHQDVDVLIVDVNLSDEQIDGLDYAQNLQVEHHLPLLVDRKSVV